VNGNGARDAPEEYTGCNRFEGVAMPGVQELVLILLIALVIFGGSKLPALARSLGRARGEFHKGLKEGQTEGGDAEPAEKKV